MGTNYYARLLTTEDDVIHIGKRSAAGLYCRKCGMSLTNIAETNYPYRKLYGTDAVHYTSLECDDIGGEPTRLDNCPLCGGTLDKDDGNISSVCSFTFAISPYQLSHLFRNDEVVFEDEYGAILSEHEMSEIIERSPIKYYNLVGSDFA